MMAACSACRVDCGPRGARRSSRRRGVATENERLEGALRSLRSEATAQKAAQPAVRRGRAR